MARRIALAYLVLVAALGDASANGRPPATSTITFRHGNDNDIAVGLTFGLLISHDGGKTWAWMCEAAVGYSAMYDPDYAFSPSGALFASSFEGLKVNRNGCTFDATPAGRAFVSTEAFGPDRAFYYAASQAADPPHGIAADFRIYKSIDDGLTFPTRGQPPGTVNWWQTIEAAPSDPMRLYLTGYRYVAGAPGTGTNKEQLLFRSEDGGVTWIPLPIADFSPLMPGSSIDIIGIASGNADHLYVRVNDDTKDGADSIYRTTDKGATWTLINRKPVAIGAFLVRYNGDLIVGTQAIGAEISHDNGDTWIALVDPPHMNCLAENAAHEVWACTQNYGFVTVPSDDAGIMKTTDLMTWTKVLRYQDLTDAVSCAPGTLQRDMCASLWCGVCKQLGCTPSASFNCPVDAEAPPPAKSGCCNSRDGGGALALGLVVGTLVLRPRRRRDPR